MSPDHIADHGTMSQIQQSCHGRNARHGIGCNDASHAHQTTLIFTGRVVVHTRHVVGVPSV